jgi:hypothetical protein
VETSIHILEAQLPVPYSPQTADFLVLVINHLM